jgi:hypothetical protein
MISSNLLVPEVTDIATFTVLAFSQLVNAYRGGSAFATAPSELTGIAGSSVCLKG